MLQISATKKPSSSMFIDECQFKITEPEYIMQFPSTCLQNPKVPTANLSLENIHISSSCMAQLSDHTPQTVK